MTKRSFQARLCGQTSRQPQDLLTNVLADVWQRSLLFPEWLTTLLRLAQETAIDNNHHVRSSTTRPLIVTPGVGRRCIQLPSLAERERARGQDGWSVNDRTLTFHDAHRRRPAGLSRLFASVTCCVQCFVFRVASPLGRESLLTSRVDKGRRGGVEEWRMGWRETLRCS